MIKFMARQARPVTHPLGRHVYYRRQNREHCHSYTSGQPLKARNLAF